MALLRRRIGGDGQDEKNFPSPRPFNAEVIEIRITKDGQIDSSSRGSLSLLLSSPELQDPNIAARIFVVEADSALIKALPDDFWVGRKFVATHLQDDEGPRRDLGLETPNAFFATWSRLVVQSENQFKMEQRILQGKSYDIDTIGDPMDRHLDHTRYYRWPDCPYRSYDLISVSQDGKKLCHAARESMSFFYTTDVQLFTGTQLSVKSNLVYC